MLYHTREARLKTLHTVCFHSMEFKKTLEHNIDGKHISDGVRAGMRGGFTAKEKEIWGDGNVLYCDCNIVIQP